MEQDKGNIQNKQQSVSDVTETLRKEQEVKVSWLGKVKERLQFIIVPFNNFLNKFPPQQQRLIKIMIVVLMVAILALLLSAVLGGARKRSTPAPTPTPTATPSLEPIPTPRETIGTPSRYATDSGVLKIEGDGKAIDDQLKSVDLGDPNLRAPDLNYDISFSQ